MLGQQKSFIGGLNQLASDTQIGLSEYEWCVNARPRFAYLEPINKHVLVETPAGNKQGLIAVGNVSIVFVEGLAYYREDGDILWTQVPNFQLSSTVAEVWSVAVPASTLNFVRKANANIKAEITLTTDFRVAGTPTGVVVQDGISQPQLIEFDFVNQIFIGRTLGDYNSWTNEGVTANTREYVPIGRQMFMLNQTLHVVARDGKSVYRSITGRPLDFMVIVDIFGNKMPTENQGGAAQISYAMDFDIITCVQSINIPDSFVYATAHNTRLVTADYNNTLFGEPTFRVTAIINSGVVNQYSFVEMVGDYAFIDFDSVKQFDAVQMLKFKGRNSIFSISLSKILFDKSKNAALKQTHCSAVTFNNYALFNLDTTFGNIIGVYDMILDKWVSFDITEVFKVKQFAIVETLTESKLYAITVEDKLYQMYANGEEKEFPIVKTRAFTPESIRAEHKAQAFRPVFNGATYVGEAILTELVDGQISPLNDHLTMDLPVSVGAIPYPVQPPVFQSTQSTVDSPAFILKDGLNGKKLSYIISWTNDAQLLEYELISTEAQGEATQKQKNSTVEQAYGQL
jgi:hypothetical protein